MSPTSCPPEALLAVHADRELSPAEARAADLHVEGCPRCRALLLALREEGRLLARVLEDAPTEAPAPRGAWADLATTGLVLLGAAAGLQALFGWLAGLGEHSPVSFDARSLVLSVLIDTLFYVLREGASMLTPLVSSIGVLALAVLTALLGLLVRRRSTASVLLLLGLVGLPLPASALERRVARAHHQEITVPAGESVDDTLFAAGDTVSIDGTVTGNLIAFAQRVIVRGTVKGDLLTGAQRVDLAGTVEGNVISFSQTLVVRGPVGRSLHGFAEHVNVDREGRVEGDIVSLAGGLDFEGRAGRDLLAFGGFANLRGEVARHASSWTDRLRVDAPAKVGGDLTVHTPKKENVTIEPQATVGGKSETRVEPRPRKNRYATASFYLWRLVWLAAAFLTGLALRRLFPSLLAPRLEGLAVSRILGIGFVALVAAPVAIAIAALTLVGLPLALLALAAWGAGLYLSTIFVGALVGHSLLARPAGATPAFPIALLAGLAAVSVAVHMPYVGWLLSPFVTLFGMGMAVLQAGRVWKAARPA